MNHRLDNLNEHKSVGKKKVHRYPLKWRLLSYMLTFSLLMQMVYSNPMMAYAQGEAPEALPFAKDTPYVENNGIKTSAILGTEEDLSTAVQIAYKDAFSLQVYGYSADEVEIWLWAEGKDPNDDAASLQNQVTYNPGDKYYFGFKDKKGVRTFF